MGYKCTLSNYMKQNRFFADYFTSVWDLSADKMRRWFTMWEYTGTNMIRKLQFTDQAGIINKGVQH